MLAPSRRHARIRLILDSTKFGWSPLSYCWFGFQKLLSQILQTPAGNDFRPFIKIENLYRHIAVVANFVKRGGDGSKINFPETGTFQVFVVGVEIREMRPGGTDDLRNRLRLRRHRFDIQNDLHRRALELTGELNGLARCVNEI